jgi:hypothetical protein
MNGHSNSNELKKTRHKLVCYLYAIAYGVKWPTAIFDPDGIAHIKSKFSRHTYDRDTAHSADQDINELISIAQRKNQVQTFTDSNRMIILDFYAIFSSTVQQLNSDKVQMYQQLIDACLQFMQRHHQKYNRFITIQQNFSDFINSFNAGIDDSFRLSLGVDFKRYIPNALLD